MKNPKYHIYLTNEERSEVLKSLIGSLLQNAYLRVKFSRAFRTIMLFFPFQFLCMPILQKTLDLWLYLVYNMYTINWLKVII